VGKAHHLAAKVPTWRPKLALGEKTHHGKAHYLVGKVFYFTQSSQLTPKVSFLTQNSSIMSKLLDCYLEKVSIGAKKNDEI
jgi:hypothetical protein